MKDDNDYIEESLRKIIEGLTSYHDDIEIEVNETSDIIKYVVFVNRADQGKVVGVSGRNIRALKTLFIAISDSYGEPIDVVLKEPKIMSCAESQRYKPDGFDAESFGDTLSLVLSQTLENEPEIEHFQKSEDEHHFLLYSNEIYDELLESIRVIFEAMGKVTGTTVKINMK